MLGSEPTVDAGNRLGKAGRGAHAQFRNWLGGPDPEAEQSRARRRPRSSGADYEPGALPKGKSGAAPQRQAHAAVGRGLRVRPPQFPVAGSDETP